MQNTEIIKRLRFLLDADDSVLAQCFRLGGLDLSDTELAPLLVSAGDQTDAPCTDEQFTRFLDGLIILRRGPSDKPNRNPVALTNNIILKKIRVAFELQARDIDNVFMLADCEFSPHEISALFRKPGTKHYVECSDDTLERFLSGLSLYFRS